MTHPQAHEEPAHSLGELPQDAHLAAIVGSSDDAIVSKSLDGVIRSWNAAAERMFGYTAAEAVGSPITLIIPPELRDEERGILERLRRGERIDHFETVRMAKDGRRFEVSLTVSPVRDDSGRIVGASKVARDISQRVRSQEALRESEARYQALFNAMDQGFCTLEVAFDENERAIDYRFLEVNPAFERQTGISNAAGRWMREIAPDQDEHWFEIYGRVARTGEPARFENFSTPLGRWWTVFAFRIGEPDQRRVAVLFNDITERKRAEEQLRRANEELERFVGIASHDLKEPLRGMSTLASFVLEDEPGLSGEGKGRLRRIGELGERLTRMIDGLLEYARSGGERRVEVCELEPIALAALDKMREALARENARVTVHGPLPVIEGDRMLLERMFANLIANAVQHNPGADKRVEIGCEGEEVFVHDNGPGIDPRHHETIFGLFRRAPRENGVEAAGVSGRTHEGVGLGLALAQNIVRSHGGRIRIRSAPGRGSTFLIHFPTMLSGPCEPAESGGQPHRYDPPHVTESLSHTRPRHP